MKLPTYASLLLLLVTVACGKSLEKQVQDQVRTSANARLSRESVEVVDLKQSGDSAVAEVNLRTAVRMQKVDGEWMVREVRVGDRRWEKIDRIIDAIQASRIAETREQCRLISQAVSRYREENGRLPDEGTFDKVIDVLNPRFLEPVIRIDAWWNDFKYTKTEEGSFEIRSAGPDGKFQTSDDITGN